MRSSKPFAFICGLQEPYVNFKKIPGLKSHSLLIDTEVEKPRAAIFHTKGLNIWPVQEFTGKDICTGLFILPDKTRIYIVSLYLPSDVQTEEMIPDKVELLLNHIKHEKSKRRYIYRRCRL